jgi:ABC-type transport system substrate-binding protein
MVARSRARFRPLAAALAGLLSAFALGALAQPPVVEEEVKGFDKAKLKRIAVEDDPITEKKAADAVFGSPPDAKLDELARAAEDAKFAPIKDLYVKHTFPFDRMTVKGVPTKIRPIPVYVKREPLPPVFGIQEIDAEGRVSPPVGLTFNDASKVEYFEELALTAARDLLKMKPAGTGAAGPGWSAVDQYEAAEKVLAAALRFHDYGVENPRERPVRKGRGWADLRKPLADELRDVRLKLLKNAVTVGDWDRAGDARRRLAAAYPNDPGITAEVAKASVLEADQLLKSAEHRDHVRAKSLLDEFEGRYPGEGGEPVRKLRERIAEIARKAFQRAKDKEEVKDLPTARAALAQAADLDRTIDGLRAMQQRLGTGGGTLYVGVREFPRGLSPTTARLDSEKQAVELMFEGLLAEVPDAETGTRYRPGAAQHMPAVVVGGREFVLRTQEKDGSGRYGFESHDVVSTLKMLQGKAETWAAYPLPWLDDTTPRDNTGVRVGFKQGHPDPRALLTFKLLPARWLEANGKSIDDPTFAERPYGTGPFKFKSATKSDAGVREMAFEDSPKYARGDRASLPKIKDVRLVEVPRADQSDKADIAVIEAFQRNALHVLPDVPTQKIDKFRSSLGARAEVVTAATNRRIYMLAVNHRRPQMQSTLLRRGLSELIDREAVLDAVFRAGKPEFHRAMTGPFPPSSWAARGPGGVAAPLLNRDAAVTRLKIYLADLGARPSVTLLYPDGDPQADAACKAIQKQVEALFGEAPGRKLTLELEKVPLRDLLERVEDEHRYDLAYMPFDYPDDWYPYALGAMLDAQAAERGGRNCFGFLAKNSGAKGDDVELGQMLGELRAYREFDALATKAAKVQNKFLECMPFIPLWQLDRHTLVHNSLKVVVDDSDAAVSPRVLNPTTLFQGVARWRLE